MTYALVSTKIMKFSTTLNTYVDAFTNVSATFTAGSKIYSFNDRVVIVSPSTTTSVSVEVYLDQLGNLTQILSYTATSFISAPTVRLSPQLTKLLIHGRTSTTILQTDFYHIDYINLLTTSLTFPSSTVFDPAHIFTALEDKWLYVRQLASTLQTVVGGNIEYVYSIALDTILV